MAFTLSLVLAALAAPASAKDAVYISHASATNVATLSSQPLPQADFALPLTKQPRSASRAKIMHNLKKKIGAAKGNFIESIVGAEGDAEYLTAITIGGQNFTTIIDTGSSDTWLVQKGFKCQTLTGKPEPEAECAFGNAYFDTSSSKTFVPLANKNFNITYGDGEFLTGTVGTDTVTVAGLTVTGQEMGVVNNAAWNGDSVNSGLMGLAFPTITSVFSGTNVTKDSNKNHEVYNPVFFNAVAQGLLSNPIFSLALNRGSFANELSGPLEDPNLGYLAFGGIAPVAVTNTSVTVPLQGLSVGTNKTASSYFYYTIDLSYNFSGSQQVANATGQAILDSGTTLAMVPTPIAQAFNALFVPPAVYNSTFSLYTVPCDATVPALSITVGGASFAVDAKDLVLPLGANDTQGNPLCMTGTQDGGADDGTNTFIMGDVFMHNVVSTFSPQSQQVTLTERVPY
jgi:hypothetical protein